jgi:hypothetical protein
MTLTRHHLSLVLSERQMILTQGCDGSLRRKMGHGLTLQHNYPKNQSFHPSISELHLRLLLDCCSDEAPFVVWRNSEHVHAPARHQTRQGPRIISVNFFTFGIVSVGFHEIDFFTFGIISVNFLPFVIISVGFHEIDFSPSESFRWIFYPSESSRWDFTRLTFSPSESFQWIFYPSESSRWDFTRLTFSPSESFRRWNFNASQSFRQFGINPARRQPWNEAIHCGPQLSSSEA